MYCLRVVEVNRFERAEVVSLKFDRKLRGHPGQFVMLNVFGFEEIPISLSSPDTLMIKAAGETTRYLQKVKKGDLFGIRGPFGRPFSLPAREEKSYLVAGGIGIAPLNYLYARLKEMGRDVVVIHGVRSSDEILFDYPEIATNDGSYGFKGNAVQLFKRLLDTSEPFRVYACGPRPMLFSLYREIKRLGALERAEFSLERYMRCGIGLCGSCVKSGGLRVCVEGPVFRGDEISEGDFLV